MLDSILKLSFAEIGALIVAGAFGLVWHYVAKIVELRKVDHGITLRIYYLSHGPETLGAIMTLLAGIWALIELNQATILSVVLLGYTIDSHANKFRSRAQGLLQ